MISIDYTLILVILNFAFLIIVLNKLMYKPIKRFLSERQGQISSDIDSAKESRAKAAELVEAKGAELKNSAEEIRVMKQSAKKDAENRATDIVKSAKDHEKKILKDTEEQLEHEKQKALLEIESELTDMIADFTEKILDGKLDSKSDNAMIRKMISERGNSED